MGRRPYRCRRRVVPGNPASHRSLGGSRTDHPLVVLSDWTDEPHRLLGRLAQLRGVNKQTGSRKAGIREIARLAGVSQETLGRILGVSARTTHRWLKGARARPTPELEKLRRLLSILKETLPTKDAIHSYLHHPHPNFGGKTPTDLLLRGEFERVEADLLAVQEGVYV